eukprot:347606-Amphidinium_carterae.1
MGNVRWLFWTGRRFRSSCVILHVILCLDSDERGSVTCDRNWMQAKAHDKQLQRNDDASQNLVSE